MQRISVSYAGAFFFGFVLGKLHSHWSRVRGQTTRRIANASAGGGESLSPEAQTASWQTEAPRGIVIYTTSITTIRKTFDDCEQVLGSFQRLGLNFDERDISMSVELRSELKLRLPAGKAFCVPQVFVDGEYMGSAADIKQRLDDKQLIPLLEAKGHPVNPKILGSRVKEWVVCLVCSGRRRVVDDNGNENECWACNENGLLRMSEEIG
ncbi:hypothetical protein CYMTET_19300 [Cymbomonas tetramitiformis]|uniref:Glutaredoxin domain-containing protein n=1 Tax=Cymbomonas tetramitiformis TaxID=36881 RepID=A0AAE0L5C9_9CHLO|nr:hypothetical protein CYMTET_19300 [Cymbomonas tetramitiformis]